MIDFIFVAKAIAIVLMVIACISLLPIVQSDHGTLRLTSRGMAILLGLTIPALVSGVHFIWWPINLIWPSMLFLFFVFLSSFSRGLKFRQLRSLVAGIILLPIAVSMLVLFFAPSLLVIPVVIFNPTGTSKYFSLASNQNLICEVAYHPGFAAPGFTIFTVHRRWGVLPFLQQSLAQSTVHDEDSGRRDEDVCNELAAKTASVNSLFSIQR